MQKHECPRCGSAKATTIMLPPGKDSTEQRPHPAFRCLACDTQWSDEAEWSRLHADAPAEAGDPATPAGEDA
ncbi:hypothetical protein SAMN04489867_2472 [Pedococcus dokdonensis]|uniref:Uncharacterized protein n=1 Tax=Pedococcus dokdonensis TaxID=443156 RepID=A0A1H0SR52_9MICO|nr:hypothetical protein [Pedococcus dokdonensis]SDP44217.1 hypothetical protein SAMN04489867_2472 [Pedococcus dokdonensis]